MKTSAHYLPSDQIILTTQVNTPLGMMHAGVVEGGICRLDFCESPEHNKSGEQLNQEQNIHPEPGEIVIFAQLALELDEYFNKKRCEFTLPLKLIGTDFQKRVWNTLKEIPYGETRTYKQQAARLGNPAAIRAVAGANAANPIAILIPCHRVIGTGGNLTGYGGGLWRKEALLKLEGAMQPRLSF